MREARQQKTVLEGVVDQNVDQVVDDPREPGYPFEAKAAAAEHSEATADPHADDHQQEEIPLATLSASLRDLQRSLDAGVRFIRTSPLDG